MIRERSRLMTDHIHTVQYYETDRMGITHHSNYIRWMEEARVAFLKEIGWEFQKLEDLGIVSPVLSVSCSYRKPTSFPDRISVHVSVKEFKGVKLFLTYEMKNEAGEIVCAAESAHAFLNAEGRPVRLHADLPEFYRTLLALAEKEGE